MSKIENIDELKITLNDLALQVGSNLKLKLNYSVESIKEIEKGLSEISNVYQKSKSEEGIKGVALEFAAYIITVIEKNIIVGTWARDSKEMGEDTFPYDLGNENYIFPYAWCLKRIYAGKEEDVWLKFKTLVLEKYDSKINS